MIVSRNNEYSDFEVMVLAEKELQMSGVDDDVWLGQNEVRLVAQENQAP